MADLERYKLSMTGAEADSGIQTGMQVGATAGIIYGDGDGSVRQATPGEDYGLPLLKGNGRPTGNTAANLGQHYFDMQATSPPYEYICVGLGSAGFIWMVYGDSGGGFTILGFFTSLEALETAISEGIVNAPKAGDAYGIGLAAPYDIYVYDGVTNTWINTGPLGSGGGSGETVNGVPPHGNAGQALVKASDTDYDVEWGPVSDIAAGSVGKQQLVAGATYAATVVTLTAAGWNNNQQTVAVAGATPNNVVIVSPSPADHASYGENGVYCTAQGTGTLTFACESVPLAAIVVNVVLPT